MTEYHGIPPGNGTNLNFDIDHVTREKLLFVLGYTREVCNKLDGLPEKLLEMNLSENSFCDPFPMEEIVSMCNDLFIARKFCNKTEKIVSDMIYKDPALELKDDEE